MLETARLRLLPWGPQDWLELKPIARDPQVTRYISDGLPWTDERTRELVERQIAGYAQLGFCFWRLLLKPGWQVPCVGGEANRETILNVDSVTRNPTTRRRDQMIGFCGLQPLEGTQDMEIGWWLSPSCWGKGLATEAAREAMRDGFARVGLDRIVAIAQPENRASVHIMDKLGMHFERETMHRGFRVVLYAISNHCWAAATAKSGG
jgi:[ribosomal protein S5]-alanine N-acetyltransferase